MFGLNTSTLRIIIISTLFILPTNLAGLSLNEFLSSISGLGSRLSTILEGNELQTELELFRGVYLAYREWVFNQYDPVEAFHHNMKLGKIQRRIPRETPFPCSLEFPRSVLPPKSVHKLRPGDIDIIAAMGDSASAGNALMTTNVNQISYENRGYSFSGGGRGEWRTFLTLPNILKVFNPKIYGYAISDGLVVHRNSRFNVAEPTAMTRDMTYQARVLIHRMRRDSNVDMQRHWKLLTLYIGNVDLCGDFCTYDDVTIPLRKHEQELRAALTLLRDNVPRLLINLVTPPDGIKTFHEMKVPLESYFVHRIFCGCILNATYKAAERAAYSEKIHLWHDLDAHIASLPEFEADDFAIVFQPFMTTTKTPKLSDGSVDLRYFGGDCFHFSQLGHAALANSLWNNMLQPVGHKQANFNAPFQHFECPSSERPYIATNKNSFT